MTDTNNDNRPRRTLQDHLKNLGGALVMVLTTLVMIEIGLRFIDPWGIAYFDDITFLAQQYEYDETRHFILPDGTYKFSSWEAMIQDAVRYSPASNLNADCTIAFLGDSVTFGYGVDDNETWVNHIAEQFPEIQVLNTGLTYYSSAHVLAAYQAFSDADAYLYLTVHNDWEGAGDIREGLFINPAASMPYLVNYPSYYWHFHSPLRNPNEGNAGGQELNVSLYDNYLNDLQELAQAGNVSLAGFPDYPTTSLPIEAGIDMNVLPAYPFEYRNSFADAHLNAEGNRILAEYMQPLVAEIVENTCD